MIPILYKYNMYNNLVQKKDLKTGLENKYGYDTEGRLLYAENAGIRYDYEYNGYGELVRKSSSGRILLAYTYNKNGQVQTQTDVTVKTIKYSYNILEQLVKVSDNNGTQVVYAYYPDGMKKYVKIGENILTGYAYDKDSRLTQTRYTDKAGVYD